MGRDGEHDTDGLAAPIDAPYAPDWLAEAGGLAASSAPDDVVVRRDWTAAISALVAVVLALSWFWTRLCAGTVCTPWQGPSLTGDTVQRIPFLFRGLGQAVALMGGTMPDVLWWSSAVSAVLGSLSCGLLAGITASVARRAVGPMEAAVCGVSAAVLWALTPTIVLGATVFTPTTLTLFLALAALACLCAAVERIETSRWLYAGAFMAGLAACNHPAFALLGVVLTLAVLAFGTASRWTIQPAGGALTIFLLISFLPLWCAFSQGESLREFLSHALDQPYPRLFEVLPTLEFVSDILTDIPWIAAVLSVPGAILLFQAKTRRFAFLTLSIALCMGPLLPALTNRTLDGIVLQDSAAPLGLLTAIVCLWVSWGVAGTVQLVLRARRHGALRACVIGLACVAIALPAWRQAPVWSTKAGILAASILDGCPKDALLVSGDASITSIVEVAQAMGHRSDVCVLPAAALAGSPWDRGRLSNRFGMDIPFDVFSTEDMTERWPTEQPVLFNRFMNERDAGETHGSGYTDLAIWEFVKANYADRPLCFVGISSPWLAARGQIAGLALLYPRRDDTPSPLTAEAILASVGLDGVERGRDGIANTISLAAVPIAQALCAQGRYMESSNLLALVRTMSPESSELGMASLRIESRQGHRDAAVKLSQDCLRQAGGEAERGRIELRIRQDLDSLSDENAFWVLIDAGETSVEAMEKRQDVAMKLWAADELTVLTEGYEAVRAFSPDDLDALYQLAAAYAQLGDLPRAHERLKRWIEVSQLPAMQVARKLFEDGRFALLQTYQAP